MSVTLKDIATMAGVSKVTVHKVLHGKPGISEKTRQKVMDIVNRSGFIINPAAASLKREQLHIAVLAVDPKPKLNFFHRQIAVGIDQAEAELSVYRAAIERHFSDTDWESQAGILEDIVQRDDVDGVVIYCNDDTKLNPYFDQLSAKNIPVITYHSDAVNSSRITCVTAPDERTGRLAAECMDNFVQESGYILVLGGNKTLKVLRDNVAGFFAYMQENRDDLTLMESNDGLSMEKTMSEVEHLLSALGNVKGVYCNSARNGIALCETIVKMKMAGAVKVITNDVFAELKPYFDNGVINATMWQDPKSQVHKAIHLMYQFLTTKKIPPTLCSVPIGIVMAGNFEDYCD